MQVIFVFNIACILRKELKISMKENIAIDNAWIFIELKLNILAMNHG